MTGKDFNPNLDIIKTPDGKQLEIDCFENEYKLGLEYVGQHNYKFPNYFCNEEHEFNKIILICKYKLEQTKNIRLIIVPYILTEDTLYSFIRYHLQKYSIPYNPL